MSDNEMLYCLVAFILGWLVSRQMGNGFETDVLIPCFKNDNCPGVTNCVSKYNNGELGKYCN